MDKQVILFTDNENNQSVIFSNFEYFNDEVMEIIYFEIEINFDFFNAKTRLEFEKSDFIYIVNCLNKMFNRGLKSFIATHNEQYLMMKFELLDNDKIQINICLNNTEYNCSLNILYCIPISNIHTIINQFEEVIN